jgi:hypothetical protein
MKKNAAKIAFKLWLLIAKLDQMLWDRFYHQFLDFCMDPIDDDPFSDDQPYPF